MRGIELVAGVIAAFFAFGIAAGVLGVMALSARRTRREDEDRRGYDLDQTAAIDWTGQDRPGPHRHGGHWEDRPGWEEPPGPDEGDLPPRWPGRRG